MSSFQPRPLCNIVLLGDAAGLRARSCGSPQTLPITNGVVCGLATSEGEVLHGCNLIALWVEELWNLSS